MSIFDALGPLLDPDAMKTIARQLFFARSRLQLRVGANLPSPPELTLAFFTCISERDRARLQSLHSYQDALGLQQSYSEQAYSEQAYSEQAYSEQAYSEQTYPRQSNNNALPRITYPSQSPSQSQSSLMPHPFYIQRSISSPPPSSPYTPLNMSVSNAVALVPQYQTAYPSQQQLLTTPTPAPTPQSEAPHVELLAHYLTIADAAYARTAEAQANVLGQLRLGESLQSRFMASKWQPGYFVCYDRARNHLMLSIRGSKEMSDFITNMSAEMEPFLSGHGHQGVVKSAENLFSLLIPQLVSYTRALKPSAFVIVGHSLGGAVASAFTMLLRDAAHLDRRIKRPLRYPICYSYSSPPFLSEALAVQSERCDITTLVSNLDMVSRLSPASVDRLLVTLSRHDWGKNISTSVGRAVENVASSFMGAKSARNMSRHVASSGARGIGMLTAGIGSSAEAALDASRSQSTKSFWKLALNATVVASSMLSSCVEESRKRIKSSDDYSYARHFGMGEREVNSALVDEAPEVFLAGKIWHLEREFTDPKQRDIDLPRSRLIRKERNVFRDVQLSGWMLHDHSSSATLKALRQLVDVNEEV